MNRILTYILGGTTGAGSSEARFGVVGLVVGVALILTGHVAQGADIVAASVLGYSGARAIPKAAEQAAKIIADRKAPPAP